MFSTRIITTDHYMGTPVPGLDVTHADFRSREVKVVPVLRIFGVTPAGQKTCMHVHGVFPYLYIPYDGTEPLERYIKQFANSIDKALNVAAGKASSNMQHVYKVALVSGVPFYGYHEREIPFLKIYLYNPSTIKKVADLLLGGAILNKIYQPYEAHIPYNLQIFIDYNLYGMNMINVSAVKFRQNPSNPSNPDSSICSLSTSGMTTPSIQRVQSCNESFRSQTPSQKKWDQENIPGDCWLNIDVERQSSCELEVDIVAADILNRLEVGDNIGSNPGLAALWEDEKQRRQERGMSLDITPPGSPGRGDIPWTDAEAELQEKLQEILQDMIPHIATAESPKTEGNTSQSYPATPSSQIEHHQSQLSQEDDRMSCSSDDTVVIDETPPDEQPVVSERSILRIVSSSQSFSKQRQDLIEREVIPSQENILDTTQDQNLTELLASLAEAQDKEKHDDVDKPSDSPSSPIQTQVLAQAVAYRLQKLEEQDSILSQVITCPSSFQPEITPTENDSETTERDEVESLEMSQTIQAEEVDTSESERNRTEEVYDLHGMDSSWNSSAWEAVEDTKMEATADSSGDDDTINLTQLDGPVEDKRVTVPLKKRLGIRGPSSNFTGSFSMMISEGETTFKSSGVTQSIKITEEKAQTKDLKIELTDISTLLGSVIESKGGTVQYISAPASPMSVQGLSLDFRSTNLRQGSSPKREDDRSEQTNTSLIVSNINTDIVNDSQFIISNKSKLHDKMTEDSVLKGELSETKETGKLAKNVLYNNKQKQNNFGSPEPTRRGSDRASKSKCVAFLKDVTGSMKRPYTSEGGSPTKCSSSVHKKTNEEQNVAMLKPLTVTAATHPTRATLKNAAKKSLVKTNKSKSPRSVQNKSGKSVEKGSLESYSADTQVLDPPKNNINTLSKTKHFIESDLNSKNMLPKIVCNKLSLSESSSTYISDVHKLGCEGTSETVVKTDICSNHNSKETSEQVLSLKSKFVHSTKESQVESSDETTINVINPKGTLQQNKEEIISEEMCKGSDDEYQHVQVGASKQKARLSYCDDEALNEIVKHKDRRKHMDEGNSGGAGKHKDRRGNKLKLQKNSKVGPTRSTLAHVVRKKKHNRTYSQENKNCDINDQCRQSNSSVQLSLTGMDAPGKNINDSGPICTSINEPTITSPESVIPLENNNTVIQQDVATGLKVSQENHNAGGKTPRSEYGGGAKTPRSDHGGGSKTPRSEYSSGSKTPRSEGYDSDYYKRCILTRRQSTDTSESSDEDSDGRDYSPKLRVGKVTKTYESRAFRLFGSGSPGSVKRDSDIFQNVVASTSDSEVPKYSDISADECDHNMSDIPSIYTTSAMNPSFTSYPSGYVDGSFNTGGISTSTIDNSHVFAAKTGLSEKTNNSHLKIGINESKGVEGNYNNDCDNTDKQLVQACSIGTSRIESSLKNNQSTEGFIENSVEPEVNNCNFVSSGEVSNAIVQIEKNQASLFQSNAGSLACGEESKKTNSFSIDDQGEESVEQYCVPESESTCQPNYTLPLNDTDSLNALDESLDIEPQRNIKTVFVQEQLEDPYIVSITPISPTSQVSSLLYNSDLEKRKTIEEEVFGPAGQDEPYIVSITPIYPKANNIISDDEDNDDVADIESLCDNEDKQDVKNLDISREIEVPPEPNVNESTTRHQDFDVPAITDNQYMKNTVEENDSCDDEPPELINEMEQIERNTLENCENSNIEPSCEAPILEPFEGQTMISTNENVTCDDIENESFNMPILMNSEKGKDLEMVFDSTVEAANDKISSNKQDFTDKGTIVSKTDNIPKIDSKIDNTKETTETSNLFSNFETTFSHVKDSDCTGSNDSVPEGGWNIGENEDKNDTILERNKSPSLEISTKNFAEGIKKIGAAMKKDKKSAVEKISALTIKPSSTICLLSSNRVSPLSHEKSNSPKEKLSFNQGQATTLAEKKEKLRLKKEEKLQQSKSAVAPIQPPKRFDNAFQAAFDMLNQALSNPIIPSKSEASTPTSDTASFSSEVSTILGIQLPESASKKERKRSKSSKGHPEKKLIKRKSFSESSKRSSDDCVVFPYSSSIMYVNGLSTANSERKTRNICTSVKGNVKVLKKDCQEHDLRMVGSEKLVVPIMNERDIIELKEQVKREVAHNLKECKPCEKKVQIDAQKSTNDISEIQNSEDCENSNNFERASTPFSEGDSEVSDNEGGSINKTIIETKSVDTTVDKNISIDLRGFTSCKMISTKERRSTSLSPTNEVGWTECIEMKRKEVVSETKSLETPLSTTKENLLSSDLSDSVDNCNTEKLRSISSQSKEVNVSTVVAQQKSKERKERKSMDFATLFGDGDVIVTKAKPSSFSSRKKSIDDAYKTCDRQQKKAEVCASHSETVISLKNSKHKSSQHDQCRKSRKEKKKDKNNQCHSKDKQSFNNVDIVIKSYSKSDKKEAKVVQLKEDDVILKVKDDLVGNISHKHCPELAQPSESLSSSYKKPKHLSNKNEDVNYKHATTAEIINVCEGKNEKSTKKYGEKKQKDSSEPFRTKGNDKLDCPKVRQSSSSNSSSSHSTDKKNISSSTSVESEKDKTKKIYPSSHSKSSKDSKHEAKVFESEPKRDKKDKTKDDCKLEGSNDKSEKKGIRPQHKNENTNRHKSVENISLQSSVNNSTVVNNDQCNTPVTFKTTSKKDGEKLIVMKTSDNDNVVGISCDSLPDEKDDPVQLQNKDINMLNTVMNEESNGKNSLSSAPENDPVKLLTVKAAENVMSEVCDTGSPEDAINAILKISAINQAEDEKVNEYISNQKDKDDKDSAEVPCEAEQNDVHDSMERSYPPSIKPLHVQLLRTKGGSQSSSRRGSSTGSEKGSEKGDVSDVDFFTMLATNMDSDISGTQSFDCDSHKQLHTPPLILDSHDRNAETHRTVVHPEFEKMEDDVRVTCQSSDPIELIVTDNINSSSIENLESEKDQTQNQVDEKEQGQSGNDHENQVECSAKRSTETSESVLLLLPEGPDEFEEELPQLNVEKISSEKISQPIEIDCRSNGKQGTNVEKKRFKLNRNFSSVNKDNDNQTDVIIVKNEVDAVFENSHEDLDSCKEEGEITDNENITKDEAMTRTVNDIFENEPEGIEEMKKKEKRKTKKKHKHHKRKHSRSEKDIVFRSSEENSRSSESLAHESLDNIIDQSNEIKTDKHHKRKSHKKKKRERKKSHHHSSKDGESSSDNVQVQRNDDSLAICSNSSELSKTEPTNRTDDTSGFSEFRKRKSVDFESVEKDVSPPKKIAVSEEDTEDSRDSIHPNKVPEMPIFMGDNSQGQQKSACADNTLSLIATKHNINEDNNDKDSDTTSPCVDSSVMLLKQDTEEDDIEDESDTNSSNLDSVVIYGNQSDEKKVKNKKRKQIKRLDSAFCRPSAARKRKRTENKKFRDTLSLLHQATVDNLKSDDTGSPSGCSEYSNEHIVSIKTLSQTNLCDSNDSVVPSPDEGVCVDNIEQQKQTVLKVNISSGLRTVHEAKVLPDITVLTSTQCEAGGEVLPNTEMFHSKVEFNCDKYSDTMSKLAYMSPVHDSPPGSPPSAKSPSHVDLDTFELINDNTEQVLQYLNSEDDGLNQKVYLSSMHVLEKFNNLPLPDTVVNNLKSVPEKTICTEFPKNSQVEVNYNKSPEIPRLSTVKTKVHTSKVNVQKVKYNSALSKPADGPLSPIAHNISPKINLTETSLKLPDSPVHVGSCTELVIKEIPGSPQDVDLCNDENFVCRLNKTNKLLGEKSAQLQNQDNTIPHTVYEPGCENIETSISKSDKQVKDNSNNGEKVVLPIKEIPMTMQEELVSPEIVKISTKKNHSSSTKVISTSIQGHSPVGQNIQKNVSGLSLVTKSIPTVIENSQLRDDHFTISSDNSPSKLTSFSCTVSDSPISPTGSFHSASDGASSPELECIRNYESVASPSVDGPASPAEEYSHTILKEIPSSPQANSPSSPIVGNNHTVLKEIPSSPQSDSPASPVEEHSVHMILKEIPSSPQESYVDNLDIQSPSPIDHRPLSRASSRSKSPTPIRSRTPSPVQSPEIVNTSNSQKGPVVIPLTIENFDPEYTIRPVKHNSGKQNYSCLKRKSPVEYIAASHTEKSNSSQNDSSAAAIKKNKLEIVNKSSQDSVDELFFNKTIDSDDFSASQNIKYKHGEFSHHSSEYGHNRRRRSSSSERNSVKNYGTGNKKSQNSSKGQHHQHISGNNRQSGGSQQRRNPPGSADKDRSVHSQDRDNSGYNQNNGNSDKNNVSSRDRLCIIKPVRAPPGRNMVLDDCIHQDLTPQYGAFCSNPQDIPERPRELGGKILKLDSSLVKELPEYISSLNGLKPCQKAALHNSEIHNMTQGTMDQVLQEMDKQPQLKIAMFGDCNMIITPSRCPPSLKNVNQWLKDKALFESLKKKETVSTAAVFDKNSKSVVIDTKPKTEPKREYKKGPNFKSSKKALESKKDDSDQSFLPISPPMQPRSILKSPDSIMEEVKSPLRKRRKSIVSPDSSTSSGRCSPSPELKSPDLFESSYVDKRRGGKSEKKMISPEFVASTPMRRVSFDDVPLVTPIPRRTRGRKKSLESPSDSLPKSKDGGQLTFEDNDIDDVDDADDVIPPTPEPISPVPSTSRRIAMVRPMRRISTGTESTLRRTLLTSQLKNQFASPVLSANPDVSQIDGPTPKNAFGFRINSQCIQDAKALHEYQYITVLSLELHIRTRGDYRPDPESDPVCAASYSIYHDIPPDQGDRHVTGVIIVDVVSASQPYKQNKSPSSSKKQSNFKSRDQLYLQKTGLPNVNATYVKTETDLMQEVVALVRKWDPDIILGYEIQMLSWGFLIQRANHLSIDLKVQLSRIPDVGKEKKRQKDKDDDGQMISDIVIPGRVVLNLWRILRFEVTLNVYSFENVVYHVLHRRIPLYTFKSLTFWYDHKTNIHKWKTIEHYIIRSKCNIEIMEKLDLIGQTSELARVFGIEFYHVLSRGSQYRVESMMLRIAKPMNYIPVSPSVQQRARMRAPECIPLTMEPQSKFYTDPVVVVDFQSLYPSIMIAYNYCFSTCIGRLEMLEKANEGAFQFGCTSLDIPPAVLNKLKNDISICPNGVCFVQDHIKKGILPRMVEEILRSRLMVKKSMKDYKGDNTLERLLHARQLGLKLIANVTFGYTSANFSGRMPCMEIGDSIVRKARETLERAIELVHQTEKWGAEVVYGDTDSMFILLKGRSKDEAFRIGQEIADAVTAANPKPIKLKFEKVYLPCVLQTKKRYVGYMYETIDQKEPVYDAKGIETVRRDSCAAVSKILEKSIKILFTSHDISRVKSFVQKQWTKLSEGRVGIQDCIFAKEYRGIPGYKPGACVPALDIARRRLAKDRRSEPRVGERVPYVIVYGTPGLPLIQLVREPHELITDPSLRINATYYITKQIVPPLARIFMLMGVDVMTWYHELPRVVRTAPQGITAATDTKKGTISQYFHSLNCPVCDELTQKGMCNPCKTDPQRMAIILNTRIRKAEKTYFQLYQICSNCMGRQDTENPCISLDCPIMFRMNRAARDMSQVSSLRQLQNKLLEF